ncbi:UNVERIFIED_CONTAM: hypothetical protein Scaly_1073700 [Sesamum calycinum]|uniref:Uncharacterized protein n=1 Tax=Sesamum calycinum TaxID=2727403 RepID=A0AAW2QL41_9LAMI
MTNFKTATTPSLADEKFTLETGCPLADPGIYKRLVERLIYRGFTKSDIAHATQQLSQFLQVPFQQYWDVAMHLLSLKYVNPTGSNEHNVDSTIKVVSGDVKNDEYVVTAIDFDHSLWYIKSGDEKWT